MSNILNGQPNEQPLTNQNLPNNPKNLEVLNLQPMQRVFNNSHIKTDRNGVPLEVASFNLGTDQENPVRLSCIVPTNGFINTPKTAQDRQIFQRPKYSQFEPLNCIDIPTQEQAGVTSMGLTSYNEALKGSNTQPNFIFVVSSYPTQPNTPLELTQKLQELADLQNNQLLELRAACSGFTEALSLILHIQNLIKKDIGKQRDYIVNSFKGFQTTGLTLMNLYKKGTLSKIQNDYGYFNPAIVVSDPFSSMYKEVKSQDLAFNGFADAASAIYIPNFTNSINSNFRITALSSDYKYDDNINTKPSLTMPQYTYNEVFPYLYHHIKAPETQNVCTMPDGVIIYKTVLEYLPKIYNDLLEKTGWNSDEVDLRIHQANGGMLQRIKSKTNLPININSQLIGNSSAPTVLLSLAQAIDKQEINCQKNKHFLIGFGAGFRINGVAIQTN